MARSPIDAALLPELLDYDPATGALTWKERGPEWFNSDTAARLWNARYAGKPAFTTTDRFGYNTGCILDRRYFAHRVCWAIHSGAWPERHTDHINGDPSDNRLANLREATPAENQQNTASRKGASSAYVGVSWAKRYGKWRATIRLRGKQKDLGRFDTEEEAFAAYCAAKVKIHTFNPVPREVQNGTV